MAMYGVNGKNVLVLGVNPSGIELVKFLKKNGAQVKIADSRTDEKTQQYFQDQLGDDPMNQVFFGAYNQALFDTVDTVVVSSGIPVDLGVLDIARTMGKTVQSELEFVTQFSKEPIIALAGTNGKSTTAHFLKSFLEAQGKSVFANIDTPLSSYLNSEKTFDYLITITNSFQLEGIKNFNPSHTLFLNLSEDHADRYPNSETYLSANREVLKTTNSSSTLVLNAEDQQIINFVQGLPGRTLFFGFQEVPEGFEGSWTAGKQIHIRSKDSVNIQSFDISRIRLRGPHNMKNLMAAILTARTLGVTKEAIQKTLPELKTLPHRLQFIKRINAVAFYDDAYSTNVDSVTHSLQSFKEPVILIMGGKDKEANFAALAPHIRQHVKNLIILGDGKEKINRAIGDYTETFIVGTIEEAILMSYQKSRNGDIVLFSPGCQADSLFSENEEGNNFYKKTILQLAQPRKRTII